MLRVCANVLRRDRRGEPVARVRRPEAFEGRAFRPCAAAVARRESVEVDDALQPLRYAVGRDGDRHAAVRMADEEDVGEVADRGDDLLPVILDRRFRVAQLEVWRTYLVPCLAQRRRDGIPAPAAAAGAVDEDERLQKPRPMEPRSPSASRFIFDFASSSAACSAEFTAASPRSWSVSASPGSIAPS